MNTFLICQKCQQNKYLQIIINIIESNIIFFSFFCCSWKCYFKQKFIFSTSLIKFCIQIEDYHLTIKCHPFPDITFVCFILLFTSYYTYYLLFLFFLHFQSCSQIVIMWLFFIYPMLSMLSLKNPFQFIRNMPFKYLKINNQSKQHIE